jgi:hypothetical protein
MVNTKKGEIMSTTGTVGTTIHDEVVTIEKRGAAFRVCLDGQPIGFAWKHEIDALTAAEKWVPEHRRSA